jgi:hypothetical protein
VYFSSEAELGFPAKLVSLFGSRNSMRNKFHCFAKLTGCFAKISCFAKQPVLHVSLFLVRSSYLRDNPIFTSIYDSYNQVAGPHHFYAALAPIKNFDAAPDPAAPSPTLLYS